jgi:hypothetical protein
VVSIQSSYTSSSKCKCCSPSRSLVSCSLLTSCLYSLNYPSCGNVICGTYVVYLTTCTTISTTHTTIGTTNGSTLPLIIFCALTSMFSYSFFTLKLEAPPSSTLFFFLRILLGKFTPTFFLFSSDVYIFSVVLLTLFGGFYGFSFLCTNKYWKIFANTKANWQVSFLSPLFSWTYLYHQSSSLHRLLNIICAQSTFYPFSTPH